MLWLRANIPRKNKSELIWAQLRWKAGWGHWAIRQCECSFSSSFLPWNQPFLCNPAVKCCTWTAHLSTNASSLPLLLPLFCWAQMDDTVIGYNTPLKNCGPVLIAETSICYCRPCNIVSFDVKGDVEMLTLHLKSTTGASQRNKIRRNNFPALERHTTRAAFVVAGVVPWPWANLCLLDWNYRTINAKNSHDIRHFQVVCQVCFCCPPPTFSSFCRSKRWNILCWYPSSPI